jgi:hypothetical protein
VLHILSLFINQPSIAICSSYVISQPAGFVAASAHKEMLSSVAKHVWRRSLRLQSLRATQRAMGPARHTPVQAVTAVHARGFASQNRGLPNISAMECKNPPFAVAIVYNQSKHACQSVLQDLRGVWGSKIRVIQVVEDGSHKLPGMDSAIFIRPNSWGDLDHFKQRFEAKCTSKRSLSKQKSEKQIVFMPGSHTTEHDANILHLIAPTAADNALARGYYQSLIVHTVLPSPARPRLFC